MTIPTKQRIDTVNALVRDGTDMLLGAFNGVNQQPLGKLQEWQTGREPYLKLVKTSRQSVSGRFFTSCASAFGIRRKIIAL